MSIYEDLIEQYNSLSEDEKNSLLVYKSRLGRAINSLNNNEEEIEDIFNKYRKLIANPKNMLLSLTVFKDISFHDLTSFKESLKKVEEKVRKVVKKILLPEDITVYHLFSIDKDSTPSFVAKTNLISTSLDINECGKFLISTPGGGYQHYLYQINLDKSSCVGICPYAILLDEKENRLILTQKQDQKELIFAKEDYFFEEVLTTQTLINDNEKLNIVVINAKVRENSISRNM